MLVGALYWQLHATKATVQLPSGEIRRVEAFPLGGSDFSPNNLIVKIELGVTAAATATQSGVIKNARLGIMDGTGAGTELDGFGSIRIIVNGVTQTVPATNISIIEITWVHGQG